MKLSLVENLLIVAVIYLLIAKYSPDVVKPNPTPDDPTPSGSIRVLIVEETSERTKLPPAQTLVFTSGDVRDYLNSHCDRDGDTSAWRIYDKDQPVADETKDWQDEFAVLKKEALPVIAIHNGRRWLKAQPLPKDVDSTLTLLKKYGGK